MHGLKNSFTNKENWLTPKPMIDALGYFDLDPCAARNMPWRTAGTMLTVDDDGLLKPWFGSVWLNPPYNNLYPFIERMAQHRNGVAIVYARTETGWFQDWVFPYVDSIFFLRKRVNFYDGDKPMERKGGGCGAAVPSVLLCYGQANVARVLRSGLDGRMLYTAKPF